MVKTGSRCIRRFGSNQITGFAFDFQHNVMSPCTLMSYVHVKMLNLSLHMFTLPSLPAIK